MAKIKVDINTCQQKDGINGYLIKLLQDNNHEIVDDAESADYLISNGCVGTGPTRDAYCDDIANIMYKKNPGLEVFVVGCIAHMPEVCAAMQAHFPTLNIIHDSDWIPQVLKHINSIDKNNAVERRLKSSTYMQPDNLPNEQVRIRVSISEGCRGECTFCEHNYMCNDVDSIPYNDLLKYLTTMVENGTRIIELTGENPAQYGIDQLNHKPLLNSLIQELSKLENLIEIYLIQIAARDVNLNNPEEFIMNPKVMGLHMDLLTVNDSCLRLMKREYTIDKYTNIIRKIRKVKEAYITSSIMCGFSTQIMKDMKDIVEYIRDNDIYVGIHSIFMYHDDPSLPSHQFPQVSVDEATEQYNYLLQEVELARKDYFVKHASDLTKAVVLAHRDNVTIFNATTPFAMYSLKEKYRDLPLGTIIEPDEISLVRDLREERVYSLTDKPAYMRTYRYTYKI